MTATSRPKSALVIGDGLLGLTCAIELQRRGIDTRLVAPDQPWRGASWGNAGHIAIEQVAPLASLATLRTLPRRLFSFGGPAAFPLRDAKYWLPFSLRLMCSIAPDRFKKGKQALTSALATAVPAWQRLLEHANCASLLRLDGHFIVWERESSARRGLAHWLNADVGTASVRRATVTERARLQALTSARIAGAVRFEGTGQIADMTALGDRLGRHYAELGGKRTRARAMHIAPADEHGCIALDNGEHLSAELIVLSAGAASRSLLTPLGIHAPLIAERGYHIQSGTSDWPADLGPVVFEDRSMIVTRFASSIRAASFVEFSDVGSPADPRKWVRLRHHIGSLGLSFEEPIQEWAGARPTLPDYLPAIGRDSTYPWLAYAFGHQHLGLTLSATTGEALAAVLCGDAPDFDLSPFSLDRFGQ